MSEIRLVALQSASTGKDPTYHEEIVKRLASFDPKKKLSIVETGDAFPLFLIGSGGSEVYFKEIHSSYPGPYFLLPLGNRNSFAAALEIKAFLNSKGLKSVLINGNETKALECLIRYGEAYALLKKLRGKRLGLIGGYSSWLIASKADPLKIKRLFGIEIVKVPEKELFKEIDKHRIEDEEVFHMLRRKTKREETLRASFYIYSALLSIKRKYHLDGFSLRCFDLLQKYQNTSCLAFALLNDRHYVAACEGDIPSLLTMFILEILTGKGSFMANPESLDASSKEGIYAHCTCPLTMGKDYSLLTHYESGMGFGIRLKLEERPITLVKVDPKIDRIVLKKGNVISNLERNDLCRTQIKVKFDEEIGDLLSNPPGNHVIFTYEDVAETLKALFEIVI